MKKRQKIAIWVIALLALLFVLRIAVISHVFDYSPPQPSAIGNIRSDKPIYFDAAVDENQNIHFIWITQGKALAYQKSTDGGKTWSLYRKFDDYDTSMHILPRILAVDNALVLLWVNNGSLFQRISLDGGVNWSNTKEVMARTRNDALYGGRGLYYKYKIDEMAKTPGQLGSVFVSDGVIYIVYGDVNKQGLYFSQSDDYGDTWSEPKILLSAKEWSFCAPQLGSAISYGNIHIVYRKLRPENRKDVGLYYLRSTDGGKTWENRGKIYTPRMVIDSLEYRRDMEGNHQLAAIYDTLMLTLQDDNFYYMISRDNGIHWSRKGILTHDFPEQFSLYMNKKGLAVVPYICNKNMEKDWWGYIPMHFVFTWDADLYWSNNDLYYALIKRGKVTKVERLTPQLSYVQIPDPATLNAIKCLQAGDKMMVFWAGKKRVEKDFTDQNIPYQIFFKPLIID